MLLLSNCSILSSPTFHEIKTSKTTRDLQQLHAQNIKTGQIRDPLVAAEILRSSALSNHRDLQYARSIFHQMEEPNCFSWNTLIRAFSDSDNPLEALFIYHLMLRSLELVEPNQFTFPSVLKACARSGAIEEGIQIHGQIIKRGLQSDGFVLSNLVRLYVLCGFMDAARQLFDRRFDSDDALSESTTDVEVQQGLVVLWNVMVDGYLRTGAVEDARWMFNKMPQRSVVSWNGMIAGYAQNCFFEDALEMFREMQMAGVSPNYVTLVSVLPAISRLGVLGLGKWVHTYVMKKDIEMNDELVSALIDMYSKCGSIGLALQVFEEGLSWKNAATWSAIIGGLAMHGRAKEAIEHFLNMEQTGVTPTNVTFIGLLSACSHAGLVDEGRLYFSKMIRVYGLSPQIEHYGCMVDLFGRAGLLEEAEEVVLNMPMKPDDVIWKALLGACKIHGNVEMGERVGKRLVELVPHDSGCYVLLSNLYASLGNWNAVSKVRLMMKERYIVKDPGCSWIEIDGMIHEFLVQDDSHPRTNEIHSMLEEMATRLKSIGYAPDASQVLLNIDEEERESTLFYHSEKIAIAFGLISTSQSTLKVVKNLRMCGDCHSSIKLISKLYARKIIVRDRNRFHHFEDGFCSCGDYW